MALTAKYVVAVTAPHMVVPNKDSGEATSEATRKEEGIVVVGIYVGEGRVKKRRSFKEGDVFVGDVAGEMSDNLCLYLFGLVWSSFLSCFCLSCVICECSDYDSVVVVE